MEGESGVNRRMIDELHSWDIQRDQLEGKCRGTRSTIDELIVQISKEIKGNVKVVLLEVSI